MKEFLKNPLFPPVLPHIIFYMKYHLTRSLKLYTKSLRFIDLLFGIFNNECFGDFTLWLFLLSFNTRSYNYLFQILPKSLFSSFYSASSPMQFLYRFLYEAIRILAILFSCVIICPDMRIGEKK